MPERLADPINQVRELVVLLDAAVADLNEQLDQLFITPLIAEQQERKTSEVKDIEDLTRAIHELQDHTSGVKDDLGRVEESVRDHTSLMRARTRLLAALFVVLSGAAIVSVFMLKTELDATTKVVDSNTQLCPMVTLIIPKPGQAAPTTERGREQVAAARILAHNLNCPGVPS